eukprot:1951029-Rhodomonas_salina.2
MQADAWRAGSRAHAAAPCCEARAHQRVRGAPGQGTGRPRFHPPACCVLAACDPACCSCCG